MPNLLPTSLDLFRLAEWTLAVTAVAIVLGGFFVVLDALFVDEDGE